MTFLGDSQGKYRKIYICLCLCRSSGLERPLTPPLSHSYPLRRSADVIIMSRQTFKQPFGRYGRMKDTLGHAETGCMRCLIVDLLPTVGHQKAACNISRHRLPFPLALCCNEAGEAPNPVAL